MAPRRREEGGEEGEEGEGAGVLRRGGGMDGAGDAAGEEMKAWCRSHPKIELHAHLNGSIRDSTLLCAALVLAFPLPCSSLVIQSLFG